MIRRDLKIALRFTIKQDPILLMGESKKSWLLQNTGSNLHPDHQCRWAATLDKKTDTSKVGTAYLYSNLAIGTPYYGGYLWPWLEEVMQSEVEEVPYQTNQTNQTNQNQQKPKKLQNISFDTSQNLANAFQCFKGLWRINNGKGKFPRKRKSFDFLSRHPTVKDPLFSVWPAKTRTLAVGSHNSPTNPMMMTTIIPNFRSPGPEF